MKRASTEFSPEVRERAVRAVREPLSKHPSKWAAMTSIDERVGRYDGVGFSAGSSLGGMTSLGGPTWPMGGGEAPPREPQPSPGSEPYLPWMLR